MGGVCVQISGVVAEQEVGLRQMLTTMGMLDSAYWLSWLLFEVHTLLTCIWACHFAPGHGGWQQQAKHTACIQLTLVALTKVPHAALFRVVAWHACCIADCSCWAVLRLAACLPNVCHKHHQLLCLDSGECL